MYPHTSISTVLLQRERQIPILNFSFLAKCNGLIWLYLILKPSVNVDAGWMLLDWSRAHPNIDASLLMLDVDGFNELWIMSNRETKLCMVSPFNSHFPFTVKWKHNTEKRVPSNPTGTFKFATYPYVTVQTSNSQNLAWLRAFLSYH